MHLEGCPASTDIFFRNAPQVWVIFSGAYADAPTRRCLSMQFCWGTVLKKRSACSCMQGASTVLYAATYPELEGRNILYLHASKAANRALAQ